MNDRTIIIGAGAAGLQAASDLQAAGKKFLILEARGRLGGRIHTLLPKEFSQRVEAGAEFIHGSNGLTQPLVKRADATTFAADGKFYEVRSGSTRVISFESG